ncbi:MAG: AarF/ABC1/UbiB kinase family protein [Nitrolancea sp.]
MLFRAPTEIFSHRRRYAEIIRILSRHGVRSVTEQLGISSLIPFSRGRFQRPTSGQPKTQAEHVRAALEDLGTTFIKLGQIMSTREDLLPPAYIAELSKLQDRVPPVPTAGIRAVIEESFGKTVEELFHTFDDEPLAAASIGQVHAAELVSGEHVVVKVQKPGVAAQIDEDLAILQQLARFAQNRAPVAEAYDLVALVDEFGWTLRSELDYMREGRNAETFRENFRDSKALVIPRIYWELTTPVVITQARIQGVSIDDVEAISAMNLSRAELATRAVSITLDEIFEHGFYHADPHPGNFSVLPDGRIVAYDFGMVGRVDDRTHDALLGLAAGIIRQDADEIVDGLAVLNVLRHGADRPGLRRDVQHLLDRYIGMSLAEYRFDTIVNDIMTIVRRRQLQMPSELALLLKTLSMQEGMGRRLDPALKPVEMAAPYIRRALIEQWMPSTWIPQLISSGEDIRQLMKRLPRRIERLLTRSEQGDIEIGIRLVRADDILDTLQSMVNRLILAILVGSSLVSLGLLLTVYSPHWLLSWMGPLFGLGVVVTIAAGLLLTWRILRHGRRPR